MGGSLSTPLAGMFSPNFGKTRDSTKKSRSTTTTRSSSSTVARPAPYADDLDPPAYPDLPPRAVKTPSVTSQPSTAATYPDDREETSTYGCMNPPLETETPEVAPEAAIM